MFSKIKMTKTGLDVRIEGFDSKGHFANSGLLLARYNCESPNDCRRISVYCMGPNYAHLNHRSILDAFKIPVEKIVGGAEFIFKNKILNLSGGSDEFGNIPEGAAWNIVKKLEQHLIGMDHPIIYSQVSELAQGLPENEFGRIPEEDYSKIIKNAETWQNLGFPLQTSL